MNEVKNKSTEMCLEVLKALAHPIRIRIVELLVFDKDEFAVGELQEELGEEQAVISHQLGVLKTRGVVKFRKDGRSRLYSIADDRYRNLVQTIYKCSKED